MLFRKLFPNTLALMLAVCMHAHAADLTVLVDSSTSMPMADIVDEGIRGGLHWELGQALAKQLGRRPKFLVLPRKRAELALTNGGADILCFYEPEWMPGPFDWSNAFIPNQDLLISVKTAARPTSLSSLAGQRVGTIFGFRYPELELLLGKQFVRDDAPSAESSLRKLEAARMQHAVVSRFFIEHQVHSGQFKMALHPYLVVADHKTRCAVSRKSQVSLKDINLAIEKMMADGTFKGLFNPFSRSK